MTNANYERKAQKYTTNAARRDLSNSPFALEPNRPELSFMHALIILEYTEYMFQFCSIFSTYNIHS